MTVPEIEYTVNDYLNGHCNIYQLSKSPLITWEIVQDNPQIPWNYDLGLSLNPNINWDIVYRTLDKPWVFGYLSKNKMSKHPTFKKLEPSEYLLR